MNTKYKIFFHLFTVVLLLTFLKIDFRFTESIYCCSDDFDYFIHTETISEDFDFDYSNQLKDYENERFNLNSKVAPIGYLGSGILSTPFMITGNIMDFLRVKTFGSNTFMNYKLLMYSFSSIFYLFLSFYLIFKSLIILQINIKNIELVLLFLGSGISYYAFERFSMTHVYEVFSTSLVIFVSSNYYKKNHNILHGSFIPLSILIGLLVRWTNYYLLLIPMIVKLILRSNVNLIKNKYFIFSSTMSFSIFLWLSYKVYGVITIDPRTSYQVQSSVNEIVNLDIQKNYIIDYAQRVFTIFTTQEFGILYFMPVLGISLIYAIFTTLSKIIKNKKLDYLQILYLLACGQVIFIVAIWRSTASAYGFRYLMGIYPLSIIFYLHQNKKNKSTNVYKLILILSFFSLLSVLFFESTPSTQLSIERIYNSFGKFTRYTQPQYLSGYVQSIFVFDSYLKMFTTSFLGAVIFKVFLIFLGKDSLINQLTQVGLPTDNSDFINYLNNLEIIGIDKFILTISFIILIVYFTNKYISFKTST
jgi:hypothetical protein